MLILQELFGGFLWFIQSDSIFVYRNLFSVQFFAVTHNGQIGESELANVGLQFLPQIMANSQVASAFLVEASVSWPDRMPFCGLRKLKQVVRLTSDHYAPVVFYTMSHCCRFSSFLMSPTGECNDSYVNHYLLDFLIVSWSLYKSDCEVMDVVINLIWFLQLLLSVSLLVSYISQIISNVWTFCCL